MEVVKSTLRVPVVITTANYGAAQVGACMVANSHGAVVGSRTTPIELGRMEEGLSLFYDLPFTNRPASLIYHGIAKSPDDQYPRPLRESGHRHRNQDERSHPARRLRRKSR